MDVVGRQNEHHRVFEPLGRVCESQGRQSQGRSRISAHRLQDDGQRGPADLYGLLGHQEAVLLVAYDDGTGDALDPIQS